jgi:hypothetical protein
MVFSSPNIFVLVPAFIHARLLCLPWANIVLLATVLRQRFQGDRLLLIAHDFAVTGDFDKLVADVLLSDETWNEIR